MSAAADARIEAGLLACVHCGLCQQACPTYLELGTEGDSPRGRIQLMRDLSAGRLEPTEVHGVRHLDLCLGCRACETACPSGVPYGELLEQTRVVIELSRPWPRRVLRQALVRLLTSRGGLLPLRLAARLPGRRALARASGSRWLAFAAALPAPAGERSPARLEPPGPARGTALLLTGCVSEALFADVNRSAAELLRLAGWRVHVPPRQGCCGALAAHTGDATQAERQQRATAALIERTQADVVVTTAAGCGAHLRAMGVRDVLALLADGGLPDAPSPLRCRVAVHDPCHLLHGQGVQAQVRHLLAAIPGLDLVSLAEADVCCGSAGTYNLTEPAMARRLLERKLAHVARSGADVVAAANPGCLLHMRAGAILRDLGVEVRHPIELLAAAHGVSATTRRRGSAPPR